MDQRGAVADNLRLYLESIQGKERDLDTTRQQASVNILKAQDCANTYYDSKHKESRNYKVNDFVVISNVENLPGLNKKLIPEYKGPYRVDAVLENDRYAITDIEGFQVSNMPYKGVVAPCRMRHWSK